MADIKQCWKRTTHERHGWLEVDGKVVTEVDASTVLQDAKYHLCWGVPDVSEPGGLKYSGQEYMNAQRNYEKIMIAHEDVVEGSIVIRERRITLEAVYERNIWMDAEWVEVQRITCFCCTCDDGSDWACRNHNMGWGMRPCELHGVDGQREVNPETDEEGEMPASVQAYRANLAVDAGN